MRKLVSAVLCVLVIFAACSVPSYASEKYDSNPIILVSGFLCSQLYLDYGTEDETNIWKAIAKRAGEYVGNDLSGTAGSVFKLLTGNTDEFGSALGDFAEYILEPFRCNPDGSSAYALEHYPNSPSTSNLEYMYENGLEHRLYEKNFCRFLSERADPGKIYCFQYDSRTDAVTLAHSLREFINEVKEYNGAEKVNIFALSFGGLITSTYLTMFESDNSVERVVMSVPAIGGTNIPDRLFRGKIDLPAEDLIKFFETILSGESNFARFFENDEPEKLNSIISSASDGIRESLKCWGSIWSLCSTELYENLKNDFLDPKENSKLIEKTDMLHYVIKPQFVDVYNRIMENGGTVSIICATGSELVAGGEYNGDVILPVEKVSGAVCSPVGKRFADGYAGIGTSCGVLRHNHVSPSMQIDASGAYLPENTWFVEGQYHGQYYYEEYTRSLVEKLLFTDEIKDIHSSPDYPQFEYSSNSYCNLHVKFNSSPSGFLSGGDSALEIKNLSDRNYIKILSVTTEGVSLDFDLSESGILSPGEEISVEFIGEIPNEGSKSAQIKVCYIEFGSMNPFCVSDFAFTVNNGISSEKTDAFVSAEFEDDFKNAVPETFYNILVKFSLRQFAECIYYIFK